LLYNFSLKYAIRRVQINQDGLKLYGKHQHLVYAVDVNIPGRIVRNIIKNTDAFIVLVRRLD
jgi:hypothetical protein